MRTRIATVAGVEPVFLISQIDVTTSNLKALAKHHQKKKKLLILKLDFSAAGVAHLFP